MKKYLLGIGAIACILSANAQQGKVLTAKDYARAESFLSNATDKLVDAASIRPNWLSSDRFWYVVKTKKGTEFILIDPVKKSHAAAFDHQKLANALSAASGKQFTADKLPFQTISFSNDEKSISFSADRKKWLYNLSDNTIAADNSEGEARPMGRGGRTSEVLSPDGKKGAYIKDYNLWVHELADNKQVQLTTDGVKDYGYATDNAGWKSSDRAILRWSPDSKKIATFKQDQRDVNDMYLVTTNVGKPELKSWKYPLPGDKNIIKIERVIINVDQPKVIRLKIPADPHRATLSDDIASSGTFDDIDWKADGTQVAFLSTSRDHKQEKFRIADAATGDVREIFEEVVATQFESGRGAINWRYLPASNEIIWYSERDNWGHLYLYNSITGKVKNQITKGDWVVSKIVRVDEKARTIYFMAGGREPGNPYFSYLYKIGFDGKNLTLLTPEAGNHQISFSPAYTYFVDSYSQPDIAPLTVVRSMAGKLISTLEKTDLSRLVASGWKPPVAVSVQAHDGKTPLYGLVYTPTQIDPNKKYPVIDYIYPGPQGGSVGSWSFSASRRDNQALAELGFIVVVIEGTSNPFRSKSFHDMSYGDMSENTLPDQITAIRQLAQKFPIDTAKVGIWGHSGGGFATAAAMFRYPDFFKVGIAESGNHDNRNYEDDWGERYNGIISNSAYEAQANQTYAKFLKGKLMLAHGMMDNNVPPSNTMLVAEALIKANKSFDLVIFPNSAHGYGNYSNYMMRRRWDYFVKNLLGAEPPVDYLIQQDAPAGPPAQ